MTSGALLRRPQDAAPSYKFVWEGYSSDIDLYVIIKKYPGGKMKRHESPPSASASSQATVVVLGNARWRRDGGGKAGQCGGDAAGRAREVAARHASHGCPFRAGLGHGDGARMELGVAALWPSTTVMSSGREVRTTTSLM